MISKVIRVVRMCLVNSIRPYNSMFIRQSSDNAHNEYLEIPTYPVDKPQSLEQRKARLIYQSRKRGMLENCLLLSTFAKKHLDTMNEEQIMKYDRLINSPSNDWDIFYWMVGKQQPPQEFDNDVMAMLKRHAENAERVPRTQPNL